MQLERLHPVNTVVVKTVLELNPLQGEYLPRHCPCFVVRVQPIIILRVLVKVFEGPGTGERFDVNTRFVYGLRTIGKGQTSGDVLCVVMDNQDQYRILTHTMNS